MAHRPVVTKHWRGFAVESPNWLDNPPWNPYSEVVCQLPPSLELFLRLPLPSRVLLPTLFVIGGSDLDI